jgi:ribosome biogenesis GTPase / thiamine phosphate phosphatase
MNLKKLGWHDGLGSVGSSIPARVISEVRNAYVLLCEAGECSAQISGNFRHMATKRADLPVVGDWVLIDEFSSKNLVMIQKVLTRKSMISRKVVGNKTEEQPLAANTDFIFIMMGLDNDFNLQRLERYLMLGSHSNVTPIIILNKKDLIDDEAFEKHIKEIETIAPGVPVHSFSLIQQDIALEVLDPYLTDINAIVLLGSSGVGKSTLTNCLLGEDRQKTRATREDDSKGRHTTTQRQLFFLPLGALLIDTPGMRELQLWTDEENSNLNSFHDIEALSASCRFNNCNHENEPNCSVRLAIENGELDLSRLESFNKLQKELKHLAKRQQESSWQARGDARSLSKHHKKMIKGKQNRK